MLAVCEPTKRHFWNFSGMISFRQSICQRTRLATRNSNTVNYSTKQWAFIELMTQFRVGQQFLHPNHWEIHKIMKHFPSVLNLFNVQRMFQQRRECGLGEVGSSRKGSRWWVAHRKTWILTQRLEWKAVGYRSDKAYPDMSQSHPNALANFITLHSQ